jgi:hypothetical protein
MAAIRDSLCAESAERVLLIGWTGVLALGPREEDGWSAKRLVSDGFTSYYTTDERLVLRGFHAPSNSDVEIALDLMTGEEIERW